MSRLQDSDLDADDGCLRRFDVLDDPVDQSIAMCEPVFETDVLFLDELPEDRVDVDGRARDFAQQAFDDRGLSGIGQARNDNNGLVAGVSHAGAYVPSGRSEPDTVRSRICRKRPAGSASTIR